MPPQQFNWTCSICSFTWTIGALGLDEEFSRTEAADLIGVPYCVNPTYGLMNADCLIAAYQSLGLIAKQKYCTFAEAYAICQYFTGVINPIGMYHFMGIRGVRNGGIWVANSAIGYRGVYEDISESQFNQYGPVNLIWIETVS